jgi:hypothetical protein
VILLTVLIGLGSPMAAMAASAEWQPGPEAVLDNTYAGSIDVPPSGASQSSNRSVSVSGWVVDRTADGWAGIDNVHIYDGLAGQGGTFLGQATFALSRPDVAQVLGNPFWANSGFALNLTAGSLAAGPHTLTVYAHTPGKGWWFSQVRMTVAAPAAQPAPASSPVNVLVRPSMITISKQQDHYSIKGYALDPNATGDSFGVDHVDVYMDEVRGKGGSVYLGKAVLRQDSPEAASSFGPQFDRSGYQIDFKPANFAIGNHHIYAYAVSTITGQETVAVTGFDIGP